MKKPAKNSVYIYKISVKNCTPGLVGKTHLGNSKKVFSGGTYVDLDDEGTTPALTDIY